MLFNTLLLSICAYFISVTGQTFIEVAIFWVQDRNSIADLAQWFQLARIIAFIDPLLNPVLVTIRTPPLRRMVIHSFS